MRNRGTNEMELFAPTSVARARSGARALKFTDGHHPKFSSGKASRVGNYDHWQSLLVTVQRIQTQHGKNVWDYFSISFLLSLSVIVIVPTSINFVYIRLNLAKIFEVVEQWSQSMGYFRANNACRHWHMDAVSRRSLLSLQPGQLRALIRLPGRGWLLLRFICCHGITSSNLIILILELACEFEPSDSEC